MNGESPHKVSSDEAESTQVIKPVQSQDKSGAQTKPEHEVAVSLHDSVASDGDTSATTAKQPVAESVSPSLSGKQNPVAPAEATQPVAAPTPMQPPAEQPTNPWETDMGSDTMGVGYDNSFEQAPLPEVHWTASEFIAHEKSPLWYMALAATSAILIAFAIFVVHDVVAVVSIALIAILFGAVASHKPRTMQYTIDSNGITIGKKVFSYGEFKSFGVVKEEAFSNITLAPLKRFSPPLSIYYPPEEEENIVQVLTAYLPVAPVQSDMIDALLRRIRL